MQESSNKLHTKSRENSVKLKSVQKLTWQSNCLRRFIAYCYYTVTYYD